MEKWDIYDETGIGSGSYTDLDLANSLSRGKIVLEVGCGRGKLLSKLQAARKYGIDMSARAIETAKEINPNATLAVASATNLTFDDSTFDVVVSIETIEHIGDYRKMISEVYRVLKPGGHFFVQTPNYPIKRLYDIVYWLLGRKGTWRDDYTHVSPFSYRKLKKAVSLYFIVSTVETRNILGENKLPFLKSLKTSIFGLVFGQKTIVVGKRI